jgi:hypothetical protein
MSVQWLQEKSGASACLISASSYQKMRKRGA